MKYTLLALLLFSITASAEIINSQQATLLALSQHGSQSSGTVAGLELEIPEGKGRVYLETYPLTKISTQASLHFAQQVACNELDVDCSNHDFLFTIKAVPGIEGGPSQGSAAALLVA